MLIRPISRTLLPVMAMLAAASCSVDTPVYPTVNRSGTDTGTTISLTPDAGPVSPPATTATAPVLPPTVSDAAAPPAKADASPVTPPPAIVADAGRTTRSTSADAAPVPPLAKADASPVTPPPVIVADAGRTTRNTSADAAPALPPAKADASPVAPPPPVVADAGRTAGDTSAPHATSPDSGSATSGGIPAVSALSDPVTTPMTGSHATYEVGTGKTYPEPDTVPWCALVAGDVVNIYWRATPYRWKFALRGSGTQAAPIVVNGVTDSSGHRPQFDFNGARTASGCNSCGANNIFDTTSQWSLENYAGILLRGGVNDDYGYKPKWIVIKNLEMSGAKSVNSFINLSGVSTRYAGTAGIWLQPSADIVLENNVVYDHDWGIFTMAKDDTFLEACERITIRSSRVYGNGVVGSYLEHNVYIQTTNPVVEGNYFGVLRAGAAGSSYKSRCSGEIFRYNYVEASARAIDWVYAEDQGGETGSAATGIATQPDYGTDYAYGNIIVNDCSLGNCAANPIHYGGDNLGEQDDVSALWVPSPYAPYRSHLYFYNNTVVNRVSQSGSYRTTVFEPSLRDTTIDAWNNVFYFSGDSRFAWVSSAGKINLRGNNLVYGATVYDASDLALPVNYTISRLGTIVGTDPKFVSATDFHPGVGSGAIDLGTEVPAGISTDTLCAGLTVDMEPPLKTNGLCARPQRGAALDLGAMEATQ